MDYCGLGFGTTSTEFSSRAFALAYAMNLATYTDRKSQRNKVDFKKAQKIYDFIMSNLDLPITSKSTSESMCEMYQGLIETLKEMVETKQQTKDKE